MAEAFFWRTGGDECSVKPAHYAKLEISVHFLVSKVDLDNVTHAITLFLTV